MLRDRRERKATKVIPVPQAQPDLKAPRVIPEILARKARKVTRESRGRRVFRAPRVIRARLGPPARMAYLPLCLPAKAAM